MVTTWLWRLLMQINFWPIKASRKPSIPDISGFDSSQALD
jgi:hypothetical protein